MIGAMVRQAATSYRKKTESSRELRKPFVQPAKRMADIFQPAKRVAA
jgi:hypothetical protein